MKKRWKIFWIVCAALAGVGIFLIVAGTALGGLVMLRNHRDEDIIHRWLEDTGIGEELRNDSYIPNKPDGEEVTAYSGINALDFELTGMGVCVQPYDETMAADENGSIIVDISDCREDLKDRIIVSQNGTELKVEMEEQGRIGTEDSGIVYISVPQGTYFEKISADAEAGLIELSEVGAKELSVKTNAGEILADSFSAERLEAECGAGLITLDGEVTGAAEISCDIGEVLCTLSGGADAYNYEVECEVGEVLIDGESYSGLNNKIKIDNGSSCEIGVDCGMGSIKIMFE